MNDSSFLGQGWSFPPTFDTNGMEMVSMEKDIEQSLQILMSTNLGERVMLPNYGCDLYSYLFESISNSRIYFLKELISTAIINYEPRVELYEVNIDQSQYLEGVINISVEYSIRTTNTRFNLVFPYYKVEGSLIPELYSRKELSLEKTFDNE